MQTEISVIIPVYKAEKHIRRCVDSVLTQTFNDFELILVNDGSPDRSGMICDELAEKDSRIKVIHKENGGSNSARRNGFLYSTGKYLVFLDSDDTLAEEALSILYNNITQGYDIVKGCVVKIDDQNKIISTEQYLFPEGTIECKEDIIIKIFNEDIAPYLCGAIYKRDLFTVEIFNKSIEANISFAEDWITNLLIADKIQKILCIKDIVYNYYVNNASITLSRVVSLDYFKRIDKILDKEGFFNKTFLKEFIEARTCFLYIRNLFIPEFSFNFQNYKKAKELLKNKTVHALTKQKIDKKFLLFFNILPLYIAYTRTYCLLFLILRQHCKRRKILN